MSDYFHLQPCMVLVKIPMHDTTGRVIIHCMEIKSAIGAIKKSLSVDWTVLGAFGNSSIAKLVVLAPFIAQAVFYSNEFFTEHLGIEKILWLYWSLMIIFSGQVLFLIRCPNEIKRYGSDSTRFIIDALGALDSHTMNRRFNLWLQSHFKNAYQHASGFFNIKHPEYGYRRKKNTNKDILMPDDRAKVTESLPTELQPQYHKIWKNIMDYYAYDDIDWATVQQIYTKHPASFGTNHAPSNHPLYIRGAGDERRWKIETLSWYYNRTKESYKKTRYTILALYSIGALYFIWHSIFTIYRMIVVTGSAVLTVFNAQV